MARGIVVVKNPNDKKLHKRLAEGGKLRIYRMCTGKTRCVICATAIVSTRNRKVHIKENPSLKTRMEDPDRTNGTPMSRQFWLQDDSGLVIGPCGGPCGTKAVMNSWLKERREEIRQQLLASGVLPAEIEKRLEQVAHQEWLNMLKVYRKAEKEATKLKIDTTSMTIDEIVEAVKEEKKQIYFKREVECAERAGVPIKLLPNGVEVVGMFCQNATDVAIAMSAWREKKYLGKQQLAKQIRQFNRTRYQVYVDFIQWALETTEQPPAYTPNANEVSTWDRRSLEDALLYIDQGNPFPVTLNKVEEIADKARQWCQPWIGILGMQKSPQGSLVAASLPRCPVCGSGLVRKTGTSRANGRRYDFYGCQKYPGCKGSLKVVDYERLAGIAQAAVQPQQTPQAHASKLLAHLQAQAQALGVKVPPTTKWEDPPEPPKPVEKKKRRGYWS